MILLLLASCVFIEERRSCEAAVEASAVRGGLRLTDDLCAYDFPDDICGEDEWWDNTTTVAFPIGGLYRFDTRGSPIETFVRIEGCGDDDDLVSCQPGQDVIDLQIEADTVLEVSLGTTGSCGLAIADIDLLAEGVVLEGPDLDIVFEGDTVQFTATSPDHPDDWSLGITDLPVGWSGEDCFVSSTCHDFTGSTLELHLVDTTSQVMPGSSTLLKVADSPTYLLRNNTTEECWAGGHFPETYVDLDCAPLPLDTCESDSWIQSGVATAIDSTCGRGNHGSTGCGGAGEDVTYRWTAPYTAEWTFDLTSSRHDTVLELREACPSTGALECNDDTDTLGSRIRRTVNGGETLVVHVDSYQGCGDYTLDIYEAGPPSTSCGPSISPSATLADAQLLPLGTSDFVMTGYEHWFELLLPADSSCTYTLSGVEEHFDLGFIFQQRLDWGPEFPTTGVTHTGPPGPGHLRVRRTDRSADCMPYQLTATCNPL